MRNGLLLIAVLVSSVPLQVWGQTTTGTGQTIFVSTFSGRQILKIVDSNPAKVFVLYTGDAQFEPEGISLGPDNKIYVCDSLGNRIWRITQDGTSAAVIYNFLPSNSTRPQGPEGPSFNHAGDLFFNTRNDESRPATGVWTITGLGSTSDAGPFNPVNILPTSQIGTFFGEGTTFDGQNNLLIVDSSGGRILKSSPSYTSATVIIPNTDQSTVLSEPIGIAVNNQNDIFVANFGSGNIDHFSSAGVFLGTYVTFTSLDRPAYMQFDPSGNLFVVTVQDEYARHGKVWRLPPPQISSQTTPTPILVVDLNTVYTSQNVQILTSDQAVGLTLAAFTTPPQNITPGGTNTFIYPNFKMVIPFPNSVQMNGAATMQVSFIPIAQDVFHATRLPSKGDNGFSGGTPLPPTTDAQCAIITNTGGNCIIARNKCFDSTGHEFPTCPIRATTDLIGLASYFNTQSPLSHPALIIASEDSNSWNNITQSFDADPTLKGGTLGFNSDEVIVNLGGCHTLTLGLTPSTVRRGSITTVAGSIQSCAATAQTVVMTLTLIGPGRPNACASTKTLIFSPPPFSLRPGTSVPFGFPFRVPSNTCPGTYFVTGMTTSGPQAADIT